MDVFTIFATIWRNKRVVIPIGLLTLLGIFYVLEVKAPVYQSDASVLLANPPSAPTTAQIAADPKLGKVNSNNPYVGYGNLVLVADALIETVSSPAAQSALEQQGSSSAYKVTLSSAYGAPPILEIAGEGSNPTAAIHSAQLVSEAISQDLRTMQNQYHVDPTYMITSTELVKPTNAVSSLSSKLRTLVGFFALGVIAMLVGVSIAEARRARRTAAPQPRESVVDAQPAEFVAEQRPAFYADSAPETREYDSAPETREYDEPEGFRSDRDVYRRHASGVAMPSRNDYR